MFTYRRPSFVRIFVLILVLLLLVLSQRSPYEWTNAAYYVRIMLQFVRDALMFLAGMVTSVLDTGSDTTVIITGVVILAILVTFVVLLRR